MTKNKYINARTICAYDRAGYGYSEPGCTPRHSANIIHELKSLLQESGLVGPYIYVGWSFGGLTSITFAGLYPNLINGIVLVDPSIPQQTKVIGFNDSLSLGKNSFSIYKWLLPIGIPRLAGDLGLLPLDSGVPAAPAGRDIIVETIERMLWPNFAVVAYEELVSWELSEAIVDKIKANQFASTPIVLLSAEIDNSKEYLVKQKQFLTYSNLNKRILINTSDHDIPFRDPSAIITAINDCITLLQNK